MKIKTLKDLKKALNKVPDDLLERRGIGYHENGLDFLTKFPDASEEEEGYAKCDAEEREYPEIKDISKYLSLIIEEAQSDDPCFDDAEFIGIDDKTARSKRTS